MKLDTIYQGDCLDVLKQLPPNSIDSVVSDPPAGISFLSAQWDKDKGGRIAWIEWLAQVLEEVRRVLKPGGHAVLWSLPRTSHWTGTAVELAGLEVRDCIFHLYGQGFPKSHDVSKALDKRAGAQRAVIGVSTSGHGKNGTFSTDYQVSQGYRPSYEDIKSSFDVTAPATPEAQEWAGWGTALKPAAEVWWLCRKPLQAPSVAAQVLDTGTGALNIDACRVPSGGEATTRTNTAACSYMTGDIGEVQPTGAPYSTGSTLGRWPANVVLSHAPGCTPLGAVQVRGNNAPGYSTANHTALFNKAVSGVSQAHYAGEDGQETIEGWECVDGCPVQALDAQSGISQHKRTGQRKGGIWKSEGQGGGISAPGDRGGASRYFYQFEYDPFIYNPKASRAERGQGNNHPTVKPVALLRHFCRLVTPPGGVVLDPFMGSGSTAVAAIREGMHFIGVEQDAAYCHIAQERAAQELAKRQ